MIARLTSEMKVAALIRRVHAAGGSAMVLAKGDSTAGAILLLVLDRGVPTGAYERGYDATGAAAMIAAGPAGADDATLAEYWQRRRARDPDLWVLELDIASGERFAAETILSD